MLQQKRIVASAFLFEGIDLPRGGDGWWESYVPREFENGGVEVSIVYDHLFEFMITFLEL